MHPDYDHISKIRAEEKIKYDIHHASIEKIAAEFGFNEKQTELIHGKAYEDHHSAGYEEVEWEFRDLCSLVLNCMKAK